MNPFSFIDFSAFSPGRVQELYMQFLNNFPAQFQPVVSVVVGVLIVYTIYRIIKRDFIFLIALAVLVPTSIPVMKSVWSGLLVVIKFLFAIK